MLRYKYGRFDYLSPEEKERWRKESEEHMAQLRKIRKEFNKIADEQEIEAQFDPLPCPNCKSKWTKPTKHPGGGFLWKCHECGHLWRAGKKQPDTGEQN